MSDSPWQPRILLQDAVVINAALEVMPLKEAGICEPNSLLFLNRHELNEAGLREAIAFARGHRVDVLVKEVANRKPPLSKSEFLSMTGLKLSGEADLKSKEYSRYTAALADEKGRILKSYLERRLDEIEANAAKISTAITSDAEAIRGNAIMHKALRAFDRTENFVLSFMQRKDGGIHLGKVIVGSCLIGLAILGAKNIDPMLATGMQIAVYTGVAGFFTTLGSHVRRQLVRAAPEISNGRELAQEVALAISADTPERVKKMCKAIRPLVIIASDAVYYDPVIGIPKNPMRKRFGMMVPEYGSVWAHEAMARQVTVVQEELEHIVNFSVGFDKAAWTKAATQDLHTSVGRNFMAKHSGKPSGWWKKYKGDALGWEMLEEINRIFDKLSSETSPKQALATMSKSIPSSTDMLEQYRRAEKEFLALLSPEEHPFDAAAEDASPPSYGDLAVRDAAALAKLGFKPQSGGMRKKGS